MTGTVLANRYRIGERIGGGGMSLVYRAEDMQLGRDVAVKVLRGQFVQDEEFVRRFRREAANVASLSHPNIVQIFDVGQQDDQYFIVMELVEGRTLKGVIQDEGPLPPAEAARIAVEIASALDHAHQHRIVHRDIKPQNILISRTGRVKVTDFGIARATNTDTVTHTGSIMGSAHYFSPEQANGQPTGEKSDIYSLGVALYEMATGVVPFQGESPITVALKHLRDRVTPPAQLNADVPLELQEIILRALEKEPDDRYASAQAMKLALEAFIADHAAGRTHIFSGDFPTMELKGMSSRKLRRQLHEEQERDEPERESKSRAWIWVTLVSLIVFGGIAAAVYAAIGFLTVPEVKVPAVVNMPVRDAQQALRAAKLSWEWRASQFSDTVPPDSVISSDPPAGTTVKQGKVIALTLSKGPENRQVPNVVGKDELEARAILETERFKVEITRRYGQDTEGRVVDMQPQPLTSLKVGATVNLVVSMGPLKVPKVLGLPLADAQKAIAAAGLRVGKVDAVPDLSRPKDTVISSDPREGSAVAQGQTVNLVVSQGSAVGAKPFEKLVIVPGEQGKWYDVAIVLVDVIGGIPTEHPPVVSGQRRAGEEILVKGTYFGSAYLRIMVDGKEKMQIQLP